MPYTADITRANPACFLYLIDQSLSMNKPLAGQTEHPIPRAISDAINRAVDEIALHCSRGMDIRDYFEIGILTYGGHGIEVPYDENKDHYFIDQNERPYLLDKRDDSWKTGPIYQETIASIFPGTSPQYPFLPISQIIELAEIEERKVKESDGAGGLVEVTRRTPVWLRPRAGGYQTPMRQALTCAAQALQQWIAQHPDSFPPIVINITDGEATDGNPEPAAQLIKNLQTTDGNALLINCHLSDTPAPPIQYPDKETDLPTDRAKQLFRMSSIIPPTSHAHATALDIPISPQSRCYIFNADLVSLVHLLNIGTRSPSNLH